MRAQLPFSRQLSRASRALARATGQRWLPLSGRAPVVTITFDDVIASACEAGAAILEAHQARGTYYVAGGLTDGQEDGHATHTVAQLARLHAAGHEIGCHGWSHWAFTRLTARELRAELDRNADFVRSVTGVAPENFAYPFGAYDFFTKRACAPRFASCRIVGGGILRERADLGNLGCWRLYGQTRDAAQWRAALDSIAAGGWAIVNTHAVEDDCGPYGCTPADLDAVLRHAAAMGARVLPVRDAIRYWRQAAD